MEQRELVDIIRTYRRRLNRASFLRRLIFALCIGGGAALLFQALAFVMPLYYANLYTLAALAASVVTAVIISCVRNVTMERTAMVIDSFGLQERIVTAYENLRDESAFAVLQRRDAMESLQREKDRIRIQIKADRRQAVLMTVFLVAAIGLSFVPSSMKERAKELYRIRQEAEDKQEEIKEVLEELEQLERLTVDTLTPEEMEELARMKENLQSSMSEFDQAQAAEALRSVADKLSYKYEDMSDQLAAMAQKMQNGSQVSAMTAEAMQSLADKMQQMGAGSMAHSGGGQNNGSASAGKGEGQDGQDGDNGGNGSGEQNKGSGQGDGSGEGGRNGQGDGSVNGQDDSGQGGDGGGSGSGSGRGTGSVNNEHDYVSIPNETGDSGNLTGNAVDHDNSEYFRAPGVISWEGDHVPYDAVVGSYAQDAYDGIAAGRYPSGMEDVIKEYFSSFN